MKIQRITADEPDYFSMVCLGLISNLGRILDSTQNSSSPIIEQIWSLYEEAIGAFYHMDYYGMVINAHQAYQLAMSL